MIADTNEDNPSQCSSQSLVVIRRHYKPRTKPAALVVYLLDGVARPLLRPRAIPAIIQRRMNPIQSNPINPKKTENPILSWINFEIGSKVIFFVSKHNKVFSRIRNPDLPDDGGESDQNRLLKKQHSEHFSRLFSCFDSLLELLHFSYECITLKLSL